MTSGSEIYWIIGGGHQRTYFSFLSSGKGGFWVSGRKSFKVFCPILYEPDYIG